MIYTTYLANIKKIPDDARKIIIMRYMPSSLNDPKYDLEWMPSLGPEDVLFNNYKKDKISFSEFREKYIEQLEFNNNTRKDVDKLIEDIRKDPIKDIYFICCEKNNLECHRRFLINNIEDRLSPSMLYMEDLRYLIGGEKKEW